MEQSLKPASDSIMLLFANENLFAAAADWPIEGLGTLSRLDKNDSYLACISAISCFYLAKVSA